MLKAKNGGADENYYKECREWKIWDYVEENGNFYGSGNVRHLK